MRYRIPPLSTLRLFEAAGRARTFAEAGKEAGVTASAVSHAIQSLEDWLGAALFARKRGALGLTPAGAEYLAAVREAFDVLAAQTPNPRLAASRLRLTAVPTFAERILVPRLPGFFDRYPDLSLSIDTSHRLATFPGDGFDAAIRLGEGPWPGLEARHLLTETLVPVCAPGFSAGGIDMASVADNLLIYTTGTDDGWRDFAAAHGRPAPDPRRGLRVDTMQMALAAAAQGMGIALARLPTASKEVDVGGLMVLSEKPAPCRQSYWFVAPRETIQSAPIQALMGFLLGEMERLRIAAGAVA